MKHTFGGLKLSITAVLLGGFVSFAGCKESGGFTGGSGSAAAEKKVAPKPTPQPAPGCTEAKLVGLKSLTTVVDQRSFNRSVDVELTFVPCPAQAENLTYSVWFDLDANLDFGVSSSQSLGYELSGTGVTASSGTVRFIQGEDLFGKSGDEFGHFESSEPLNASPALTKAVLKIKLNAIKILGPALGAAPTGNFQIPLHVKVGNAEPVTGNLTFTLP